MDSREYWQKREEEALKHYLKDEKEYDKRIKQIYADMLDSCQQQIDSFYGRYAAKEGISLAEAKKRVSKLDIAAYERKAKRYVREKNFSKQANEEMRLYNATMKINRMEMLKANIGLELISGHDELEKYMGEILQGRTMEELERQAGILGKTVRNNAKTAHAIVNGSFQVAKVGDQSTFSDLIWQYQDLMREDLGRLLQTGLIQGKNPRALAKDLRKYWYGADPRTGGGATYCMERLMRTELARVQTEAQKQSFDRNGFDEYMFISNEHGHTCSQCNRLDGKHFKVKDMMPGKNAPPMHPNCRCSTAAWVDDEEYEAWLDYLDKGGTTAEWEASGKAAWEKQQNAILAANESGKYHAEQKQSADIKRIGTNAVDMKYIRSDEFRRKFSRITENSAVNEALRQYADAMLSHRKETDGEDLYIINSKTGELLLRKIADKNELGVVLDKNEVESLRSKYKGQMIGIHNHPTNLFPTGSDFGAAGYRGYDFGVVVTHDGRVFKYSVGNTAFLPSLLDAWVVKYEKEPYNKSIGEAHKMALDELKKEYGITWEEMT